MLKSRRPLITKILVVLFIVSITSYLMVKIVQKEQRKQLLAESVTPSIVWDIKLSPKEFIGDLSQVGTYLLYSLPDNEIRNKPKFHLLQLDDGKLMLKDSLDENIPPLADPSIVGLSKLGKKEFRIEQEQNRWVVAQYNISTGARGLIAKLPEQCTAFKTVQRLPQNFFALEGVCVSPNNSRQWFKRILVVDLETRRIPYMSSLLNEETNFIAFK